MTLSGRYGIRFRVRIKEVCSEHVVVRLQMYRTYYGNTRFKGRSGYQFGIAWRDWRDTASVKQGLMTAMRRAVAACSFDPDHPDSLLLVRKATNLIIRQSIVAGHRVDLTLHSPIKGSVHSVEDLLPLPSILGRNKTKATVRR